MRNFLFLQSRWRGRWTWLCQCVIRACWAHWRSKWMNCLKIRWAWCRIAILHWLLTHPLHISRSNTVHLTCIKLIRKMDFLRLWWAFIIWFTISWISIHLKLHTILRPANICVRVQSLQLLAKKVYSLLTGCKLLCRICSLSFLPKRRVADFLLLLPKLNGNHKFEAR